MLTATAAQEGELNGLQCGLSCTYDFDCPVLENEVFGGEYSCEEFQRWIPSEGRWSEIEYEEHFYALSAE